MNVKTFHFNNNYKFFIKYNESRKLGICKYPRETVSVTHRPPSRVYYNHKNEIVKQIIYPQELWYKQVFYNDPFENTIIEIKNSLPDWTLIEILKNEKK